MVVLIIQMPIKWSAIVFVCFLFHFQESKGNRGKSKEEDISEDNPVFSPVQYLYIQMEFCEKSTLRTAIDAGMYEDKRRLWTHFREIIEGLAHIHLQVHSLMLVYFFVESWKGGSTNCKIIKVHDFDSWLYGLLFPQK